MPDIKFLKREMGAIRDLNQYFMDDMGIYFGTGQDAFMRWDGTDMDVLPSTNNYVWKWGNGTLSWDMWWYGSAAANYALWDASADAFGTEGAAHLHLSGIDADAGEGVGSVIQMGTSGTPLTSAEDETELLSCYFDSTGKNAYGMRMQVTKTSVSAGAPRVLTLRAVLGHTTGNGPQGANAVDARATLDKLGGTGISGEMHAMESQCRVEDTTRTVQGTYAAHKFTNNFQTGNTMPAATTFFVRFRDEGDVKTPKFFEVTGTTAGTDNMFSTTPSDKTDGKVNATLLVDVLGVDYWIPLWDAKDGS